MATTYNTGNAIGSKDVRDLSDNASGFDYATNSPLPSWIDRFNKRRQTFAGMEAAFQDFLVASGFAYIGEYAAGITFSSRSQYVVRSGVAYRLAVSTAIPYVLTGTWATDQPKLFAFPADAALRSDLASSDPGKGAALVAGSTLTVPNVAALLALPSPLTVPVYTLGYYTAGDGGGTGPYYWDALSSETANGGTIFGSATAGRIKLATSGQLNVKVFGAKGDGATDDSARINACLSSLKSTGGKVYFPTGVYIAKNVTWTVETTSFNGGGRIGMEGDGPALSILRTSAAVNGDNLVNIVANTATAVNSVIFGVSVSNMGFEILNGTGNTFRVVNSAYMYYENCYFRGGIIAFKPEGCLSSTFVNCKFTEGQYGFYATPGFSFPNQFSFFQCVFGINTSAGLYAQNPGGIRMFGGSVEGNGAGNAGGYGVLLDHAASTSSGTSIAGVFEGVYFEFNNGNADLALVTRNNFENLSLTVDSCSFACGGDLKVNDRISIEHQATSALTAKIEGCNFQELSGFVPSTSQKYIKVFGGGTGSRKVYTDANYYNHPNAVPDPATVLSSPASNGLRVDSSSAVTNASGIITIAHVGYVGIPRAAAAVTDGTAGLVFAIRRIAASPASSTFEVMKQALAGGAWSAAGSVSVDVTFAGS